MDKGYIENGFIVDVSNAHKTSEIIYELSRILDLPDAQSKKVCLKLGSVDLTPTELTSIKALVESMNSEIEFITTSSDYTIKSARELNIKISELENKVPTPEFNADQEKVNQELEKALDKIFGDENTEIKTFAQEEDLKKLKKDSPAEDVKPLDETSIDPKNQMETIETPEVEQEQETSGGKEEQQPSIVQTSIDTPTKEEIKTSISQETDTIEDINDVNELKLAIENASKYDRKIIIEEGIKGKEVECAILEKKDEIIASTVGEIKSAEEFYSFDAKYNIPNSQTIIPAKIEKKLIEEIQKNAIKAFKSIDGRGLARVDFFIEEGTNNIYINEINTMPGFTKISMYPKLFESDKISYSELLDILINYAISKFDFT